MTKVVPVGKFAALVDDEDYAAVSAYRWRPRVDRNGGVYARRYVSGPKGATQEMQCFLTGYALTDHRNHDTLDNRRANLREATHSQSGANRRKARRGTYSSKYKGVNFHKASGKWQASIRVNKKPIHLGLHKNESDAARAYNTAALEHFGEFAYLNDIP